MNPTTPGAADAGGEPLSLPEFLEIVPNLDQPTLRLVVGLLRREAGRWTGLRGGAFGDLAEAIDAAIRQDEPLPVQVANFLIAARGLDWTSMMLTARLLDDLASILDEYARQGHDLAPTLLRNIALKVRARQEETPHG